MTTSPLPIAKGLFMEINTGKRVHAFYQKHNADAGETGLDDCFITISEKLDCGEMGAGESGQYPPDDFRRGFKFLAPPKPLKFGN